MYDGYIKLLFVFIEFITMTFKEKYGLLTMKRWLGVSIPEFSQCCLQFYAFFRASVWSLGCFECSFLEFSILNKIIILHLPFFCQSPKYTKNQPSFLSYQYDNYNSIHHIYFLFNCLQNKCLFDNNTFFLLLLIQF